MSRTRHDPRWTLAACVLASSLSLLLAARAVQGIGAALLLPNSLALLNVLLVGKVRMKRP